VAASVFAYGIACDGLRTAHAACGGLAGVDPDRRPERRPGAGGRARQPAGGRRFLAAFLGIRLTGNDLVGAISGVAAVAIIRAAQPV
jgi:hypothetical protein